jgi:hypothetical protein
MGMHETPGIKCLVFHGEQLKIENVCVVVKKNNKVSFIVRHTDQDWTTVGITTWLGTSYNNAKPV